MTQMRLGNVATFENGRAFKPSDWSSFGIPIIRIENLTNPAATFNRYSGQVEAKHRVDNGDLLVSWSATLDAFVWNRGPAVLNQHIFKARERVGVDRTYLYYALRDAMARIRSRVHGATMQHVTKRTFESVLIFVPSLVAQRDIAARLADELAAVDTARRAALDRRTAVDALRTRTYHEAFRGIHPLTVGTAAPPPNGWMWTTLTSLARLESGHTPSRYRSDWWGGDIPWIALPDIRALDGRIAFETAETTNADGIAHSSARILPAETVVMSRTASVGFVTRMGRAMATSQDFVNWVCGPELDPEFLMHLLIRSRTYVRSLSSGATHKTVYLPSVKAFRVCVPSLSEQRRIATQLRDRLLIIGATANSIQAELEGFELLPAALIRRAILGREAV